uniref:Uncharacterized protein n=1 Tax=Cannabis sativa TaxID=3483 RepID=A0A803QZ27_CANSA
MIYPYYPPPCSPSLEGLIRELPIGSQRRSATLSKVFAQDNTPKTNASLPHYFSYNKHTNPGTSK